MKRLHVLALGVLVAIGLVLVPAGLATDHETGDEDGDGLPWIAEVLLCNNGAIRTIVDTVGGATGAFGCADGENFTAGSGPNPEPPQDADGDNIPDSLEPTICKIESSEVPQDGECNGSDEDYTPPEPGVPANPICQVEDPENESDGSCDEDGNYTPPSGVPVPDPMQVVCDVVRQNENLGSCDGDNNYTPPGAPGVDPNAVLCQVVNQTPQLGSCDNDNNYTPPPAPPVPTKDEVLCGLENPNTDQDGKCENGEYTPPGIPSPPPVGPSDLVPEDLNCGGHDDPRTIVEAFLSDADCDGDNNMNELAQGCDPLDEESNTAAGCEGSPIPQPPGGLPDPRCSGYDPVQNPEEFVFAILSDADCDGQNNMNDPAPLDPNQ